MLIPVRAGFALLALLTALSIALGVAPHDRADWLLENALLFGGVAVLVATHKALPLSRISYTLIFVFACLHSVGAHYTYSLVPYDAWVEALTGRTLSSLTGWERNHYDRLVHFLFGLLVVVPSWRFSRRIFGLSNWWSAAVAFSIIMSASAAYEIVEWLIAVSQSDTTAESYNGQQGDVWDPQWDMALAGLGSLVGLVLVLVIRPLRTARNGS